MISSSTLFSFTLLLSPVVFAQAPFLWDQVRIAGPRFPIHLPISLQLTPSQNLDWVSCYSTFQCARLEVSPLRLEP
jgi:hypothetical protein